MVEPGYDTDLAVAKSLGLSIVPAISHRKGVLTKEWTGYFRPSTDLNIAFWAAEKAGLFAFGVDEYEGSRFVDRVVDGGVVRWRVCRHIYDLNQHTGELTIGVISSADSIPLAICAAILS